MITAGQRIVAAWRRDDRATWQSLIDAIDAQLRDTIDSERGMAVAHAGGSVTIDEVRRRLREDLEDWRRKQMITEEELAAMQARADAATQGPFFALGRAVSIVEDPNCVGGGLPGNIVAHCIDKEMASLFAHAREDVPRLIEEVRRLRAALEVIARKDCWNATETARYALGVKP